MKQLPAKERLEDAVASVLAGVQDELLAAIEPIVQELAKEAVHTRIAAMRSQLLTSLDDEPPPPHEESQTLGCTARGETGARRA